MILRIGLTGGIGSGKSTVAAVFRVLGVPVYSADEAARRIMNTDATVRKAIREQFGGMAYVHGELNRRYIATIVFDDPFQLDKLNALVHPATISDAAAWMAQQKAPYAIKEAAILFESGSAENLDYIIGVTAPEALRIQRVMERDAVSREEVKARIDRQINESLKMKLCDFVIVNDEQQAVLPQVLALHQRFLEKAAAGKIPPT